MNHNNVKLFLILLGLVLINASLVSAGINSCWEMPTPRSNSFLNTSSNITIAVFHNIQDFSPPVNVTFIMQGNGITDYKTFNSSTINFTLRNYYNGSITVPDRAVNNVYVEYTYYNVSKGTYNFSVLSVAADGSRTGAIECYYADWEGCIWHSGVRCPVMKNRTNVGVGTYITPAMPIITIQSFTTTPTNGNITVFATVVNGTLDVNNYTFTQNGAVTFIARNDSLTASLTVTITNIDKTAPTATVAYSTTAMTNQSVIASLVPSESIVMLEGNGNHTFNENGNYTFKFRDLAGNTANVTAIVTNINKTVVPVQVNGNYSFKIVILAPVEGNYTTNVTQLKYIVYATNSTNKTCWFNNGVANSADMTCAINTQYTLNDLTVNEGWNTWKMYVRNTGGYVNSTSVTFFINRTLTPRVLITPVSNLPIEPTPNVTNNSTVKKDEIDIDFGKILWWVLGALALILAIWYTIFHFSTKEEKVTRLAYICAHCGEKFIDNSPKPFIGDPDRTWNEIVRMEAVVHTQLTGHNAFVLHDNGKTYKV